MSTTSSGNAALGEFKRAPSATQDEFWAAIRKRTDWEHELSAHRESMDDPEAAPPIEMRRRKPKRVVWNESWKRKARSRQFTERCGLRKDGDFGDQRDRLLLIDPPEFVERLTGDAVGYNCKIACPLPDHEDGTSSFHAYESADRGWYCFGCLNGGGIYELAGMLWGLERYGNQFRSIHERLVELFLA